MSVRFSNNTSQFIKATGVLPATSPCTLACWAYVASLPGSGAYNDICGFVAGASGIGPVIAIFNNAGTIRWDLGTSATDNVGTNLPIAGVWYHVTLVCPDNSNKSMYINGVLEKSASVAETPSTQAEWGKAGDFTTSTGDCRIAYAKVWNAALSQDEIIREMWCGRAARRQQLFLDAPFNSASQLYDYSGYNHAFTTGTAAVTTEEGPPNIPWQQKSRKKSLVFMPGSANAGGAAAVQQQLMLMGCGS